MQKVFFILIIFTLSLYSNSIKLSKLENTKNILEQTQIYIDKNGKNKLNFVLNNSDKFIKNNDILINKGFTNDTLWLKFSIFNDTNSKVKKVINIDNHIINNVILYTKNKNGYKKEIRGVLEKENFKNILTPYFEITLESNSTKKFYLELSSKTSALIFSIFITNKDLLYEKEIKHQLVLVLFFGSLLTLILYNFFIFLFSRDIVYLYYVSYFFLLGLYYSYYTNIIFYLVDIKANFLGIYLLSFMLMFLILLTRSFLDTFRYKKIDLIFKIIIFLLLSITMITSKDFYPIDILIVTFLFCLFFILFVAFYSLKYGNQQNRYFLVGWLIAVIGYINFALFNYGYSSLLDIFPYFYELCIILEALIFSTVLVNKLNLTKRLEKEVEKNKILTKELHHRVKNNMQFIISMYRLKLNNKLDDETKNDLNELENTIQVMSKTHEMLYKNSDLEYINTEKYFEILIKDLSQTFDMSKIKINIDAKTKLNMEQTMMCGIILNETITNTLKYAFKNSNGIIKINLSKNKKTYTFTIEDNGIGFDTTKKYNTFGLLLIKSISKCNLNGNFDINSTNGTKITIKF